MKHYTQESSPLRPLFGAVAIALTIATVALAVVVPARFDAAGPAQVARSAPPAAVATRRMQIDVVAVRDQATALEAVRHETTVLQTVPERAAKRKDG